MHIIVQLTMILDILFFFKCAKSIISNQKFHFKEPATAFRIILCGRSTKCETRYFIALDICMISKQGVTRNINIF